MKIIAHTKYGVFEGVKNEYDENFNKISTIYMGTIAGIGFNHKVN